VVAGTTQVKELRFNKLVIVYQCRTDHSASASAVTTAAAAYPAHELQHGILQPAAWQFCPARLLRALHVLPKVFQQSGFLQAANSPLAWSTSAQLS
jgi:hypothetical protein